MEFHIPHWEDAYHIKSDGRLYYGDIAEKAKEIETEVGEWLAFARTDDGGVTSMEVMSPDFYADMSSCESILAEQGRWDGVVGGPEDLKYARDLRRRAMDAQMRASLYSHTEPKRYDLTTGVFHVSEGSEFDAKSLAVGPRRGFVQDGSFVGSFVSAMGRYPYIDVSTYVNDITGEVSCVTFRGK